MIFSIMTLETVMLGVVYAQCHQLAHYAKCRYAECRYAECRYDE